MFDRFGIGLSDRLPRVDAELWCRQICQIMDARGVTRAHFLGLSFGALLVAHFESQHPERVVRVGLLSPIIAGFGEAQRGKIKLGGW